MRVSLDGIDGLSLRVQYLEIPMSPAEQATFFARWGDDIRNTIAEGFGEVKKALHRIQFFHEMHLPLERLAIVLELDREYDASEIGHFRFFASISLPGVPDGVFMATFGETDRIGREQAEFVDDLNAIPAGIINGKAKFVRELIIPKGDAEQPPTDLNVNRTMSGGWSSGQRRVGSLYISYGYPNDIIRLGPNIRLADLDNSMLALFLNDLLANKVKTICVFGNVYKLIEYSKEAFFVSERSSDNPTDGLLFTADELSDKWVRIMGKNGAVMIRFSETTPTKIFEAR